MQPRLKRALVREASVPYRPAGLFAYHWVHGKLAGDPVFAFLLSRGLLLKARRVLDLGCGRGLLGAWFLAAQALEEREPQHWASAVPRGLEFRGVDCDAMACRIGNQALQARYGKRISLVMGDICEAEVQGFDTVVLLDVLHYISHAQQDALLDRIQAALAPGGQLIMRVGDARGGWRFRFSRWVDLLVAWRQGLRVRQLVCRPVPEWELALRARGFEVAAYPMSEGTLFANVLLVATAVVADHVK